MNRVEYYNYIDERLTTLSLRIERRGKLNILDYHIHSENFYRDLFNLLYGWKLENLNDTQHNVEAIDLIDSKNKIVVQVSATNTKAKIDGALSKPSMQNYTGLTFKFISIARCAGNLRNNSYTAPQGLNFTPTRDIYDLDSILKDINSCDIDKMKSVYDFIWKELGKETSAIKLESNLTNIIKLLSQEDLSQQYVVPTHKSFEIDRKIDFNQLTNSKALIAEYKIYQGTVNKIYSTFDKDGQNKSVFVLGKIRKIYLENNSQKKGDELYKFITDSIKSTIINSSNFESILDDELEMCVDILVVDAFIRCKIFENPENYNYVNP